MGKADRFYGPALLSGHSFERSLQLAFAYPLLALLAGWVFFDAGTLGGLPLLPDSFEQFDRVWRALLLIALGIFLGWIFTNLDSIEARFSAILTNLAENLDQRVSFLAKVPRWSSRLSGFVVTVGVVIVVVGAVLGVGAVVGVIAVAVVGVIAVAGVVAGVVAVVVVVAVVGAGFTSPEEASIYLIFFLLLPFLNGVADALSVAATRRFLRHIPARNPHFWSIAARAFVDLCVALLCLGGLILSLWGALLAWEALLPSTLAFDWRAYWGSFLARDPAQSMILILMAVTTLIPTMIHLGFGLAGFWAAESRGYRRAVRALRAVTGQPSVAEANTIVRNIRLGIFWVWFRSHLSVALLCAAILYLAQLGLRHWS